MGGEVGDSSLGDGFALKLLRGIEEGCGVSIEVGVLGRSSGGIGPINELLNCGRGLRGDCKSSVVNLVIERAFLGEERGLLQLSDATSVSGDRGGGRRCVEGGYEAGRSGEWRVGCCGAFRENP